MDPLGDVLLAVHEDLGDDFFCMICTNMTYMCHILSHLALKNYFLAVLEKSLSWVMVVTLILESLLMICCTVRQVTGKARCQISDDCETGRLVVGS